MGGVYHGTPLNTTRCTLYRGWERQIGCVKIHVYVECSACLDVLEGGKRYGVSIFVDQPDWFCLLCNDIKAIGFNTSLFCQGVQN